LAGKSGSILRGSPNGAGGLSGDRSTGIGCANAAGAARAEPAAARKRLRVMNRCDMIFIPDPMPVINP
jgi:hypothetical protein